MSVMEQTAAEIVRRVHWEATEAGRQSLVWKEWLVTNGLGGYSSGTVSGGLTRRYHALLVAALPAPFGRTVMFNYVWERLRWPDGRSLSVPAVTETEAGSEFDSTGHLVAFRLEAGLPVWTYDIEGVRFEKRVLMPHLQNTTHISYRLLSDAPIRLELRPFVAFRLHEAPVNHPVAAPYTLQALGDRFEIRPGRRPASAAPVSIRGREGIHRAARDIARHRPTPSSRIAGTSAVATCGRPATSG